MAACKHGVCPHRHRDRSHASKCQGWQILGSWRVSQVQAVAHAEYCLCSIESKHVGIAAPCTVSCANNKAIYQFASKRSKPVSAHCYRAIGSQRFSLLFAVRPQFWHLNWALWTISLYSCGLLRWKPSHIKWHRCLSWPSLLHSIFCSICFSAIF